MIYNVNTTDNIQQVIDNALPDSAIVFASGIYYQKLVVNTPRLTLTSSTNNAADVVITYDDYAKKLDQCGNEYNTFRTYSLAICADCVTLQNITVANSNVNPKLVGQCVALSVCGNNFVANNCVFTSTQDTLFCSPLPDDLVVRYLDFLPSKLNYVDGELMQKYLNCTIIGSVDFIFGCANALFEDCNIISINCGETCSYVAAPAHSLKQTIGFIFVNCHLTSKGCPPQSVYLARPWRDFGLVSYINCDFGAHINPVAFDKWNDTQRDRTARFYLYNCTPLSNVVSWSKTLTTEQVDSICELFNIKL